ncbi:hypothetical protein [Streptomyces sp. AJS327]|uniref:hypothetical protein n=1 Tax=Streptomyces sp. AJS327 TaxID=2545265 RepID=UPI0015DFBA74|nr:hypothetical protein [Streptomyces sp. AJS327]
MNDDFTAFVDDLDDSAELSVHRDDDMVSIVIAESDGERPVDICLNPDTARRVARAITLTSFLADGEDVADLEEELGAQEEREHPDHPMSWPTPEERLTAFIRARVLAGPDASLGDTLELARFLVGEIL